MPWTVVAAASRSRRTEAAATRQLSEWRRDRARYEELHEGLMLHLNQAHAGAFARAVALEFGIAGSAAG